MALCTPMASIHCSWAVMPSSQMLAKFQTPVAARNATAAPKNAPVWVVATFGPLLVVVEAMANNLSVGSATAGFWGGGRQEGGGGRSDGPMGAFDRGGPRCGHRAGGAGIRPRRGC